MPWHGMQALRYLDVEVYLLDLVGHIIRIYCNNSCSGCTPLTEPALDEEAYEVVGSARAKP